MGQSWAAWYNNWLLIKLTPKGIIFSFLFFSYDGAAADYRVFNVAEPERHTFLQSIPEVALVAASFMMLTNFLGHS